ncbi:MAG TPA: cytochrome c biogenesis protein [Candidatus Polarisedimenticolaceae bacterium]|nr:cytochrome c biogenesis protein [Candidatus Polarisedimenticolaceae bacterium]
MARRFDAGLMLLLAATAALMALALALVFLNAPEEKVMGAVQKIFYFHVPIAAMTFLAVFVLLAGSVGYLWTRRAVWDHVSVAATEVGLVFCTLVLITGPIWAKPAWGVWWTWEAKLTTTLILWLLLAGSLLARAYATAPDQAARIGSILGVVAALDVPVVYKAVDWWRGQHPIVFGAGKTDPLAPGMGSALMACMFSFLLLFTLLVAARARLAALEGQLAALEDAAARAR